MKGESYDWAVTHNDISCFFFIDGWLDIHVVELSLTIFTMCVSAMQNVAHFVFILMIGVNMTWSFGMTATWLAD